MSTPRTDHGFPRDDLDLQGKADRFPDLYDLAHVTAWEPYNLHDLCNTDPGLDLYNTGPAKHLITAG